MEIPKPEIVDGMLAEFRKTQIDEARGLRVLKAGLAITATGLTLASISTLVESPDSVLLKFEAGLIGLGGFLAVAGADIVNRAQEFREKLRVSLAEVVSDRGDQADSFQNYPKRGKLNFRWHDSRKLPPRIRK